MNNISQISIFEYREIENLGDLERLKIFFENIDDDKLCEKLEKSRKNGRNDYPVRTMLNLIYAMKIFGHRSVESFRRELSRNSQLRIACGLNKQNVFDHFIRGQKKMELMLNLTFIVMLTIAKGHIKNKQENIRSLVA